jgi:hypothetical protein
MYPLTCRGGFPMPIKAGRFEVIGFRATVKTTTSDSRVRIIDDPRIVEGDNWGYLLPASYTGKETPLADVKGMADIDSNLEVLFPEPVKTRWGISVYADNIEAGSLELYVR